MRPFAAATALLTLATIPLAAQAPAGQDGGKKVLSIDDYTRWRTIGSPDLSPDGKWAVYVLQYANTLPADAKPVLHIRNLGTSAEVEVADGTQPRFSPDSRWIIYQVESAAAEEGRAWRQCGDGRFERDPRSGGRA